jgi:antitoxin component HigA of HigAB toxin-antitoxin module
MTIDRQQLERIISALGDAEKEQALRLLPLDEGVVDLLLECNPQLIAECREISLRMEQGDYQDHEDVRRIVNAKQGITWTDDQMNAPETRRLYEQERLVLWATELVSVAMEESNVTKADLARKLGTSRAHVTQLLAGSRNLTLRSLADLAWACGARIEVRMDPLDPSRLDRPARVPTRRGGCSGTTER